MTRPESHRAYVRRMRMRRRQMLRAVAMGGSLGLISFLSACAGGPAPSPTPAPTQAGAPAAATPTAAPTSAAAPTPTSAAPTATATPQVTPAPAGQAKGGAAPLAGALHLFLQGEADTIDPGRASFVQEIEIVMRVFSNLYTFDSKAQLVPDQADGMPQVSPDGKTITVKLKKGLTWSDGKPLTAKDFVYGVKRQLNPAVAGDYAFTLYVLEGGEKYNTADPKKTSPDDLKKLRDAVGVSAPDDTTIVYKLTSPAPWFLSVLATW
ncbi:MAG TPA: ABC transporter substrate-binding protein, partial [Chloroflexota bacterium]|nr:ABC transporter substrate-binding protein [Chloroflexota bacterium]